MRFYLKSQAIHRFLQKKHSWSFKKLTHQFGMESIKSWNSLEYVVLMFPKKKKKIIVIYWIGLLWLLKSALQYLEHVRFFLFWFGMEQLLVANGGYYLFKFWVEGFWTLLNFTALEGSALLKKSVTCRSFTLRDGLVGRIVTMVLSWLESHINSLELKRY